MSEYKVEAYLLSRQTIESSFGSRNQAILNRVLKDRFRIIANYKDRFSGKTVAQAVADLINGETDENKNYPFHYAFAAWAIIAEMAEERPTEPLIGYPFMSLYDFCKLLKKRRTYRELLKVFQSLDGQSLDYALPIGVEIRNVMPCIAYIEEKDWSLLANEINRLRAAIENEQDWTWDIEEPDEIFQVLDWFTEAASRQLNLCLVMEGDL